MPPHSRPVNLVVSIGTSQETSQVPPPPLSQQEPSEAGTIRNSARARCDGRVSLVFTPLNHGSQLVWEKRGCLFDLFTLACNASNLGVWESGSLSLGTRDSGHRTQASSVRPSGETAQHQQLADLIE